MTSNANAAALDQPVMVNGVEVDQVMNVIDQIETDAAFAKMQFRVKNRWMGGGLNRSPIKDFYAGCEEDDTRAEDFVLDADEPAIIAGGDTAPDPVEYVLHALAGCLTTTMIYHAAVRGVVIEGVESELEGDLGVRGLFGLSNTAPKRYRQVRVRMRVRSEAGAEQLRELAMYSPVFDLVSASVPVDLVVEKL